MNQDISLPEHPIIFINYRRTDAGWPADLLADKLRSTFGHDRVFLDVRGIDAGDDFAEELEHHLQRAGVLLVLIGKQWLFAHDKYGRRRLDHERDWVRREIRTGLNRKGCRVIPVLLDDAELPDEEEALPSDIAALLSRQHITVRQTHTDDDIEALITVLAKHGFRRLDRASVSLQDDTSLRLTRPKSDVAEELRGQIERGKILLEEFRTSPPSSAQDLYEQSRQWHQWRRYSEQVLRDSFSTDDPLRRLQQQCRPGHLQFDKSWEYRAKQLPSDVAQEVAFCETLLGWIDNYDEMLA